MINELKLDGNYAVKDLLSGEKIDALLSDGNIKLTVKMTPEQVRLFSFKRN
jgi:hypothetical protein